MRNLVFAVLLGQPARRNAAGPGSYFGYRRSAKCLQNPTTKGLPYRKPLNTLAPRVGFEPTTLRLTAGCSAVELSRIK